MFVNFLAAWNNHIPMSISYTFNRFFINVTYGNTTFNLSVKFYNRRGGKERCIQSVLLSIIIMCYINDFPYL